MGPCPCAEHLHVYLLKSDHGSGMGSGWEIPMLAARGKHVRAVTDVPGRCAVVPTILTVKYGSCKGIRMYGPETVAMV
jgi:hypothetical protein